MYKKIVALFCAFSILSLTSIPASADLSDAFEYGMTTFFEYLDYCGHVYGNDEFRISEWWKALTNSEDPEAAYDSQVSELPATGVTSSGGLVWHTTLADYHATKDVADTEFKIVTSDSFVCVDHLISSGTLYSYDYVIQDDHTLVLTSSGNYSSYGYALGRNYIQAPIEGYYSFIPDKVIASISYRTSDGVPQPAVIYTSQYAGFSRCYCYPGEWIQFEDTGSKLSGNYLRDVVNYIYTYDILIEPADQSVVTNNYTIDSRPTSITGDYGIIGDNGQITKVDNTTIVNETNNIYTNPSTGTTSTITDWTYDYSDRSYDLTLESGDTITVTYGDENVTIQEGDTVYNIYYIIEGTGEVTDPDACQHTYTSTVDQEATCTVPGQKTYTCSLCGDTYTEAIPAKGHIWTILQTVTTEYDEEGNLLQQGYTLYQCSVCGEQYKDEDGTGPPSSGGADGGESVWDKLGTLLGTVFGGIIGLIESLLGAVLDALTSLASMIAEKLTAVVDLVLRMFTEIPGLFTGFLGFLTAVFPFLPEDIMLLLTFGIAVVVFIGIINALRR